MQEPFVDENQGKYRMTFTIPADGVRLAPMDEQLLAGLDRIHQAVKALPDNAAREMSQCIRTQISLAASKRWAS